MLGSKDIIIKVEVGLKWANIVFLLLNGSLFYYWKPACSLVCNTISISGPPALHVSHIQTLGVVLVLIFLLELNLVIYLASLLPSISPGATLCLDFCKALLIKKSYSSWMCPHLREDSVYTLEPGRTGFKTWFCHLSSSWSKKLIFSKLLFPFSWSWDNHAVQEMQQEILVWFLGQEGLLVEECQPFPVFLPWKPHGERSLLCYSPWVTKSWTGLSKQPCTQDLSCVVFLCILATSA